MNFAFAPTTLTTGCSPIVFVTTPPQPASNARVMLLSDSVGGADERRNGFSNSMPVKLVVLSAIIPPENEDSGHRDSGLGYPILSTRRGLRGAKSLPAES